ncbi:hypothetical protein EG68_04719 [Paragonimus skrjabini miyazakii]|uniref:Uncharacterized protein n=1 Tax=Paragonimus skrjabini miyazakii TaxID=59628 RepID=A0A8S9YTP7_9TREM|nr:hypothetical protein EG68_04719 [Paragonimus skrjabini miyazakii]
MRINTSLAVFYTFIVCFTCGDVFDNAPLEVPERLLNSVSIEYLPSVLNTIKRALAFLLSRSPVNNVDGILGPRIVENTIGSLLSRYWNHMPYSLVAELIELQQLAEYTSRMGIHYVRLRTPEYFSSKLHSFLFKHRFNPLSHDFRSVEF